MFLFIMYLLVDRMDKELAELHSESCRLNVQVEISDERHSSGISDGTGVI